MADITKLNYNGNNYNIGDSKARQNISNEFSTTTSYSTNDLVIYEGLLYKFTSDHSVGAWNSSEAILTNINIEKLSDAPSDGEQYVRKDGEWAISLANEGDSIVFGDDSVIIQPGEGAGFYGDAIDFQNGSAIITTSQRTIKNLWDIVADSFTTSVSYSTDDYVIHNENLYKFIVDHPAGDWDENDVVVTTIEDGLNSDSGGGNSGGEGGKAQVMYFYQQTVNTATNAEIFRITDPRINTDTVVLECTFANPEYITGKTSWISYEGYIAFTGTCTTATTANVTMAYKSEENISNRLMTLIWENANPNSNFADQILSLDFSNYDFIIIETKMGFSSDSTANDEWLRYKINSTISKGSEFTIVMLLGAQASLSNANKYSKARRVIFTDSSIHFSDCISRQWNVTTANFGTGESQNGFVIPLKIWGISKYTELENLKDTKARVNIANDFDETKNYSIGDMVLYDGLLYQFTSAHAAGAWNSSHVVATTIGEQIEDSGWRTLNSSKPTYYRKIGNIVNVVIQDSDNWSGNPTTLGTLPSGYRPKVNIWLAPDGGMSSQISTAGVVTVTGTGWFAGFYSYIAA